MKKIKMSKEQYLDLVKNTFIFTNEKDMAYFQKNYEMSLEAAIEKGYIEFSSKEKATQLLENCIAFIESGKNVNELHMLISAAIRNIKEIEG